MASSNNVEKKLHNTLLVVEGESAEPKLVQILFDKFVPDAMHVVYPYRANIHDLIEKINREYYGDYESIEICRVLAEMLPEDDDWHDRLLYTRFTDVILMFDFDPQDDRFDKEELRRMLEACCDSTDTDKGLLLINYPAVEAVKEAASLSYEQYLDSFIKTSDLRRYKEIVNDAMRMSKMVSPHDFTRYNVTSLLQSIAYVVGKVQYLVDGVPLEKTFPMSSKSYESLSDLCAAISGIEVFDYEVGKCNSKGLIATCGLGPLFIANWGRALDGAWKKCFG